MAEGKICVCPQCGKKYKLKEGFNAASFACTACGATVWAEGKPPAPTRSAVKSGSRTKSAGRGRGARSAGKAPPRSKVAARGRRGHEEEADDQEDRRGRRGRARKKNNNGLLIVGALGGLVLVGIVVFVMMSDDKGSQTQTAEQGQAGTAHAGTGMPGDPTAMGNPAAAANAAAGMADGSGNEGAKPAGANIAAGNDAGGANAGGAKPAEPGGNDAKAGTNGTGDDAAEPKRLTGKTAGGSRRGRYDPPADLGHLESTPAEQRKEIDELIKLLIDPQAGRDSLIAKQKLALLGKPAFLPLLGAMAKIRDTITDVDSMEERLIESSLLLGDQCLREMDGYLESYNIQPIRPGTDKKYIEYILRLHYKRWVTTLEKMNEMPGAYDMTRAYDDKDEDAPELQDGSKAKKLKQRKEREKGAPPDDDAPPPDDD
jgi:hypothetical protein